MVSIPACHAGDPGSIPGRGASLFLFGPNSNPKQTNQDLHHCFSIHRLPARPIPSLLCCSTAPLQPTIHNPRRTHRLTPQSMDIETQSSSDSPSDSPRPCKRFEYDRIVPPPRTFLSIRTWQCYRTLVCTTKPAKPSDGQRPFVLLLVYRVSTSTKDPTDRSRRSMCWLMLRYGACVAVCGAGVDFHR